MHVNKLNKVAVLGPKGTYTDLAAQKYPPVQNGSLTPVYFASIDDTVHSVGADCGWGIVPIENMLDGYVQRTLDLMRETNNHIVHEITVPVSFAVAGHVQNTGEIKRLYVQPTASGQCRTFINSLPNASLVMTESNMQSFNFIKNGQNGDAAVIPCHMLENAPAPFILENITDAKENYTRFIVIKNGNFVDFELCKNQKISSSMFILPEKDQPGLLFKILEVFYQHHVNLVSIISRPTQKRLGFYNFYIEVNGQYAERENILHALDSLCTNYPVKLLGIYSV